MLIPMLIFILYQSLMLVVAPFIISYTIVSNMVLKQHPWKSTKQVMGFVPEVVKQNRKVIWIHGYRVGELVAMQQFIKELKRQDPSIICYVTIQDAKEKKSVKELLQPDYISIFPHDNFLSITLAFKRIKPDKIILLEREVWPSVVMLAKMRKVPTYLVNAQVAVEDELKCRTFPFFYKNILPYFTHIFAQSEFDKTAFVHCGVAFNQASVLGNIKSFNSYQKRQNIIANPDIQRYAGPKPVLLAGSIYEGELEHYLEVFNELKPLIPSLKLVVCPRFSSWKEFLIEKVKKTGHSFVAWDEIVPNIANAHATIVAKMETLLKQHDIVAVFVMGTMFHLCSLADIYYLGGTWVPVGGHNLLDSASWGNPMIIGPHYYFTKHVADRLEKAGALIKIVNKNDLVKATSDVLFDKEKWHFMHEQAQKWIQEEFKYVEQQVQNLITIVLKP